MIQVTGWLHTDEFFFVWIYKNKNGRQNRVTSTGGRHNLVNQVNHGTPAARVNFLSIHLSIYLSIYLYLSIFLSFYISILNISIYISIYLSIYQSIYLGLRLTTWSSGWRGPTWSCRRPTPRCGGLGTRWDPTHRYSCLSIYQSIYLYVCLSVYHLSIYQIQLVPLS